MDRLEGSYKVLELERGASAKEIQWAYRRLAKLWHPDFVLSHPQLRKKYEAKMRDINEAYAYLKENVVEIDPKPAQSKSAAPEQTAERNETFSSQSAGKSHAQKDPGSRRKLWGAIPPIIKVKARSQSAKPGRLARALAASVSLGKVGLAFLGASLIMLAPFFIRIRQEHVYWGLLLLVVSFSGLYGMAYAIFHRLKDLALLLAATAVLFNPALPLTFSTGDWAAFRAVTPIFLACVFFEMYRRAD